MDGIFTGLREYTSDNVGLMFYAHYTARTMGDESLLIENYLMGTSLQITGPHDVLAKLDGSLTNGTDKSTLLSLLAECVPDAADPMGDLIRGGLIE